MHKAGRRSVGAIIALVIVILVPLALISSIFYFAGMDGSGEDCLCLSEAPTRSPSESAPEVITATVHHTVSQHITRVITVVRSITRFVPITLPHGAVTEQLRLMYEDPSLIPRVRDEDLNAVEERGGCYITDMFLAEIGGIYYHIYVCMLTGIPSDS